MDEDADRPASGPDDRGSAAKTVELLFFTDCPNYERAWQLLDDVLEQLAPGTAIVAVEASDPAVARRVRFPGSPTIRVDGRDVDPDFVDPGDYTPRCRLYRTKSGVGGLPDRSWVEDALRR